ncbi:carbonic anhydrase [Deltaproteobacteria bacterium]|nr:carbonic anhydrase [Deltaproteobacteria bacterium]
MKKLLDGIRDFHDRVRPSYRERFAHLALGHSPDCLFIACADSRVVPNLFASTDPGDLFVLRNVGNIVPPDDAGAASGAAHPDDSAGAAVEFAILGLAVRDIVVCGHSSCGAMRAVLCDERPANAPNLDRWLQHTEPSRARLEREPALSPLLPQVDRLSQAHVLQQLDHLRSYPAVAERLAAGKLNLHGWWFDLSNAEVLAFDGETRAFSSLAEQLARRG